MTEDVGDGGVVNARIVFWGAEGAGKTTNLHAISAKLRPDHRGELRSVPSACDATVHYEELPIEVEAKTRAVEGVTSVQIDLVWDPPWDPSKMSEAARLELGMI